jgi:hypothetical protein
MKNSKLQFFTITKNNDQLRLLKNERNKIMFKNIYKLLFTILLLAFFTSNITEAQTKKITYPLFSIAPVIGVQFPAGGLNDEYKASWNAGLEMNLKVNRETSFWLKAGYYDMPVRSDGDISFTSGGSYIEITAGPRYVFTKPNLKAKFFLEAGLGAYIFNMKEYTYNTYPLAGGPAVVVTVPSASTTNLGVNVGPGVLVPLGGTVELIMKAKLHYIFESGASRTFITAMAGVDFNL